MLDILHKLQSNPFQFIAWQNFENLKGLGGGGAGIYAGNVF